MESGRELAVMIQSTTVRNRLELCSASLDLADRSSAIDILGDLLFLLTRERYVVRGLF